MIIFSMLTGETQMVTMGNIPPANLQHVNTATVSMLACRCLHSSKLTEPLAWLQPLSLCCFTVSR